MINYTQWLRLKDSIWKIDYHKPAKTYLEKYGLLKQKIKDADGIRTQAVLFAILAEGFSPALDEDKLEVGIRSSVFSR